MTAPVPVDAHRGESLRIDRLLFFLRVCKSRSVAQKLVAQGHLRVNGRRVTNAAQQVRAGDVITLPAIPGSRLLHIGTLPQRRGPAREAAMHYREIATAPSAQSNRALAVTDNESGSQEND